MKMLDKKKISIFNIVICIVLCAYVVSWVFMLGWGIVFSCKSEMDYKMNGMAGFPSAEYGGWQFKNYITAFTKNYVPLYTEEGTFYVYMDEMVLNSLIYTVGGAFCATMVPCLVAYIVERYEFKFLKIIHATVIVTMLLPIVGSLPAEMQLMRNLGFLDGGPFMEFLGVMFMKCNFLGLYFLIFYGVFKGLSRGYEEAAYIDGASQLQVLLHINLPLIKTSIASVYLLQFIGLWNDYQTPMIYWSSRPVLAYGMYMFKFSTEEALSNIPVRIAGGFIMALPIIILFLAFQKRLLGNITAGGLKG